MARGREVSQTWLLLGIVVLGKWDRRRFGVFCPLPLLEGQGTELGEVRVIALVNRDKRQVGLADEVVAAGHVVGLIHGRRDNGVAGKGAHAKLARGRLIVGITETV